MSEQHENKDGKRNGLITTILVHLCLLVICAFFGFTYMNPPKGDIAIGFESVGVPEEGANTNLATAENVQDRVQEEQIPDQSDAASNEQDMLTQDDSDVALNDPDKSKSNKEASKKNTQENQSTKKPKKVDQEVQDMASLIGGQDQTGGAGAGNGNQNNGGGGSAIGPSGGGGGGLGDISTRTEVYSPKRVSCPVDANVKLRITVRKDGSVVKRSDGGGPVYRGGAATSDCAREAAISIAENTKYNPSDKVFIYDVVIRINKSSN